MLGYLLKKSYGSVVEFVTWNVSQRIYSSLNTQTMVLKTKFAYNTITFLISYGFRQKVLYSHVASLKQGVYIFQTYVGMLLSNESLYENRRLLVLCELKCDKNINPSSAVLPIKSLFFRGRCQKILTTLD